MNAAGFWRIFWKEYRSQRALWLAMAVLTLVLELALLASPRDFDAIRVKAIFGVAFVCAACYTLGAATTLFAAERENETYGFLQSLPVTTRVVFLGKVVFSLGSAVAMYLLAWIAAWGLARELPDGLVRQRIWVFCGLGGAELFAWGVFFSLLLRRSLVAAVLAGTIGSIGSLWYFVDEFGSHSTCSRWVVLVLVAAADVVIASRWFRERLLPSVRPRCMCSGNDQTLRSAGAVPITLRVMHSIMRSMISTFRKPNGVATPTSGGKRTTVTSDVTPRIATMLGRFLWQEVRQSTALKVATIVWLLPAAFLVWVGWCSGRDFSVQKTGRWPELLAVPGFWVILSSSLLFLADQTRCRFRFLAEQGIPPRLLWLGRQIGGLIVVLWGLLLMLPPTLAQMATLNTDHKVLAVESLFGLVVLAYCCGQLCSMVFRSGIIAVVCGMILTALVCEWAVLMYVLGLSWSWSVAPMPLAFLTATLLHVPNWLVERRTWRTRLRLAVVVVLPMLTILVAVPAIRIYEIPSVAMDFDAEEVALGVPPEEDATLALYARAIAFQKNAKQTADTASGKATRQELEALAAAVALEASRRPLPEFYLDPHPTVFPIDEIRLAHLVLASGKTLEAEGEYDAALARYVAARRIALHACQRHPLSGPVYGLDLRSLAEHSLEIRVCEQLIHWAAHSGRKADRVLKALRTFEQQWREEPSHCYDIQCDYRLNLRILNGDWETLQQNDSSNLNLYVSVARWVPWERARAVRLLNMLSAETFACCQKIEPALAAGERWPPLPNRRISPALWRDYTFNLITLNLPHLFPPSNWPRLETYRRATRLMLALQAWKLDHGHLPPSLDDLKGKYLSQIPVAANANEEFRYAPQGVPYYVKWNPPDSETAQTIEPGQPFLVCGPESTWIASPSPEIGPRPPEADNGSLPPETVGLEGEWALFPIP